MGLVKKELSVLHDFIPSDAVELVIAYMHQYKIHLKIKRERKTVLGDYRPSFNGKPHTISVNANLNKYHFLITFIHELAHLINYIEFGRSALPHGKEWKQHFSLLLKKFIDLQIFPQDVTFGINRSIHNLSASTCSDPQLFKILYRYDEKNGKHLVEQLSIGDTFKTEKGDFFVLKQKRRTRFACENIHTKKIYLFPGIYEVFKE
ncbi:MAG: SprT-like domain-containing protein [Bacteroidetes bacterium]|jgi:SprT protein|nr:SprT-like domain-containing protein [Bacteroidota bacterium]